MKTLIFYTSHRQIAEIAVSAKFFNRTKHLKGMCDVLVHCNNPNVSDSDLLKVTNPFMTNRSIVRSKNTGFKSGLLFAIAECFDMMSDYDWVIHLHPDVYIVDDTHIFRALNKATEYNASMIVNSQKDDYFCTDMFAFRPKEIPNIFLEAIPDSDPECPIPERFLWQKVHSRNITYLDVPRIGGTFRFVDSFGMLHSHDLRVPLTLLDADEVSRKGRFDYVIDFARYRDSFVRDKLLDNKTRENFALTSLKRESGDGIIVEIDKNEFGSLDTRKRIRDFLQKNNLVFDTFEVTKTFNAVDLSKRNE